jgi:hypothetical protein
MYALSLYCYQPDDILSFAHYLKLSLAESSVLMALIWSVFSTFFFSLFPFLTYPDELLLEVLPCYLHVVFTFTTNFLWSSILLYIHHRTQIAIDARKCGVWERSPAPPSDQHKCPNWRQGHKYSHHAVVAVPSPPSSSSSSSSKGGQGQGQASHQLQPVPIFRLLSPSSSYPFSPNESLLAYRAYYFPLLAAETGPLFRSKLLSFLLLAVLANICAILGAMLLLPSQVSSGLIWLLSF